MKRKKGPFGELACSLELSCPAQEKHVAQFEKQCATNAYAMTINKSQGQTLSHVGLHLVDDVFLHGQLYVTFSHTKASTNFKVQLPDIVHDRIDLMHNVCVRRNPPLRLHASPKWLHEKLRSQHATV
jgi:hypothetical protein